MFQDTRQYLARDERLEQFYGILAHAGAPLTVGQVARRAGMAKTKHVQSILDELTHDGDAIKFVRHTKRSLPTNYYAFLDQSLTGVDYDLQIAHASDKLGGSWFWDGAVWTNTPPYGSVEEPF